MAFWGSRRTHYVDKYPYMTHNQIRNLVENKMNYNFKIFQICVEWFNWTIYRYEVPNVAPPFHPRDWKTSCHTTGDLSFFWTYVAVCMHV